MVDTPTNAAEPWAEIEELKTSTIRWSLSGLLLAASALYLVAAAFPDPLLGALPGVILLLFSSAVWILLQKSFYRVATCVLLAACFGVNLMLISWTGLAEAVIFLALPVGLTAVLIGLPASIATAAACTCYLLFGHAQIEAVLRFAVVVHIWVTIWLVWLTSRPLLLARQWFEASYDQSREALEKSRDYQFQLRRALDDLTEANHQFAQLHRLAHNLRAQADAALSLIHI